MLNWYLDATRASSDECSWRSTESRGRRSPSGGHPGAGGRCGCASQTQRRHPSPPGSKSAFRRPVFRSTRSIPGSRRNHGCGMAHPEGVLFTANASERSERRILPGAQGRKAAPRRATIGGRPPPGGSLWLAWRRALSLLGRTPNALIRGQPGTPQRVRRPGSRAPGRALFAVPRSALPAGALREARRRDHQAGCLPSLRGRPPSNPPSAEALASYLEAEGPELPRVGRPSAPLLELEGVLSVPSLRTSAASLSAMPPAASASSMRRVRSCRASRGQQGRPSAASFSPDGALLLLQSMFESPAGETLILPTSKLDGLRALGSEDALILRSDPRIPVLRMAGLRAHWRLPRPSRRLLAPGGASLVLPRRGCHFLARGDARRAWPLGWNRRGLASGTEPGIRGPHADDSHRWASPGVASLFRLALRQAPPALVVLVRRCGPVGGGGAGGGQGGRRPGDRSQVVRARPAILPVEGFSPRCQESESSRSRSRTRPRVGSGHASATSHTTWPAAPPTTPREPLLPRPLPSPRPAPYPAHTRDPPLGSPMLRCATSPTPSALTSILRTAGCGPACPVVWQGC